MDGSLRDPSNLPESLSLFPSVAQLNRVKVDARNNTVSKEPSEISQNMGFKKKDQVAQVARYEIK